MFIHYFKLQKGNTVVFRIAIYLMVFLSANTVCFSSENNLGEPVFKLTEIGEGVKLNEGLMLFKDESRKLGIQDVINMEFTTTNKPGINLGYNTDADWIKFNVYNNGNIDKAILRIDKLLIDSISLYTYNIHSKKWDSIQAGESIVKQRKPIVGFSTSFPIDIPHQDTTTFYLRCVSSYSKSFTLSILNLPLLHHEDMMSLLFLGLYIGILVAITLYNLFLGISIRDKLYLHYVMANLSSLFGGIALEGFFVYFTPERFVSLIPYINSVSTGFYVLLSGNFIIRFLELKKYSRLAYFSILSVAVFIFVVIIVLNLQRLAGKQMHYSFITVSCFLFSLAAFISGVVAWKKGARYARFYLIGWAAVFIGLFLLALTTMGYLPKNAFTSKFYAIGVSLEVLLLSFALADRYSFIQKEKNKLELELQYKNSDLTKVITDNRMRHSFKLNLLSKLKGIQQKDGEYIKQELGSFITDLNIQIDADEKRNRLQENIDKINTEFEKKLKERFPKLTKSEIEVCGYLKLNLSVKEIASIRKTSETAVKVTKHRINKKMQESGSSIDEMIYGA